MQASSERAATLPWVWRKAWGGWTLDTDNGPNGRLFHAYDQQDHAACDPDKGLASSVEPVNEGSHLCPTCIAIVKAAPRGRKSDPNADPNQDQ